jgi:hypothetical protein
MQCSGSFPCRCWIDTLQQPRMGLFFCFNLEMADVTAGPPFSVTIHQKLRKQWLQVWSIQIQSLQVQHCQEVYGWNDVWWRKSKVKSKTGTALFKMDLFDSHSKMRTHKLDEKIASLIYENTSFHCSSIVKNCIHDRWVHHILWKKSSSKL